uniref:THAP-type domain-containing protein n=1 Tax=Corethrella appendiculata TaxID=1370023 RepID=U5EPI9_9DIPT
MRNCFVPKCDAQCRNNPRRAMFLAPKDEKLFKIWQQKLPQLRVFKKIDKVCERHFVEDDIIKTWDHSINGNLIKVDRAKPTLRETAVPCLNLPTDDQLPRKRKEIKRVQKSPTPIKKTLNTLQKPTKTFLQGSDMAEVSPIILTRVKSVRNAIAQPPQKKLKLIKIDKVRALKTAPPAVLNKVATPASPPNTIQTLPPTPPKLWNTILTPSQGIVIKEITVEPIEQNNEPNPEFDNLYDEVFEIELPSTLWGIHRDPDREFLAFTEFNISLMMPSKILLIENTLTFKISIKSKVKIESKFEESSLTESIQIILGKLDEVELDDIDNDKNIQSIVNNLLSYKDDLAKEVNVSTDNVDVDTNSSK